MSTQEKYETKIERYHEQVKLMEEKKLILKNKEDRVSKMKSKIQEMEGEVNQSKGKLQTIDFLLESSVEEQAQIKQAVSKDRYSSTLRSKLHNVNLDLEQQFEQEIRLDAKLTELYEEMIHQRKKINEQHNYMGHLKDDVHRDNIKVNTARKLLYED